MASGGDSIAPELVKNTATIGCFARTNTGKKAPVALTAMHLVTDAGLLPSASLRFVSPSPLFGHPGFLGTLFRGTQEGTDAAAILLDSGILPTNHIREIGLIKGCRAPTEKDKFKPVRLYGVGSGKLIFGRVESDPIAIPSLRLDEAILLSLSSTEGDSGAAIVAKDDHVIALLVGRYKDSEGLAVATSITSVLAAVKCHMP